MNWKRGLGLYAAYRLGQRRASKPPSEPHKAPAGGAGVWIVGAMLGVALLALLIKLRIGN